MNIRSILELARQAMEGMPVYPPNVAEGYRQLASSNDPVGLYKDTAGQVGANTLRGYLEWLTDPMNHSMGGMTRVKVGVTPGIKMMKPNQLRRQAGTNDFDEILDLTSDMGGHIKQTYKDIAGNREFLQKWLDNIKDKDATLRMATPSRAQGRLLDRVKQAGDITNAVVNEMLTNRYKFAETPYSRALVNTGDDLATTGLLGAVQSQPKSVPDIMKKVDMKSPQELGAYGAKALGDLPSYLHFIATHPQYMAKVDKTLLGTDAFSGIGGEMFKYPLLQAYKNKSGILLDSLPEAITFHLRNGFRPVGKRSSLPTMFKDKDAVARDAEGLLNAGAKEGLDYLSLFE